MECGECARLASEWEKLRDSHIAAILALNAIRRTAGVRDYLQLANSADQAWLGLEHAERELKEHHRDHVKVIGGKYGRKRGQA
jgi:hypothetical protein